MSIVVYLILLIPSIIYSYYLRNRILKTTKVDGPLAKSELIGVITTLVINVLISATIYYFGLYKKFPKKSKEINKYATIILLIMLTLQYVLHFPLFVLTR
jgi:hypothetical protein